MKPTDEAYRRAYDAFNITAASTKDALKAAVDAAYAAQFQSKDYAGLINWLRDKNRYCSTDGPVAADAIEVLLAERDALKAELAKAQEIARVQSERIGGYIKTIEDRDSERDALLARLAPVDDEALVEIVADAISDGSKNIARAAIAAIRPHIEAVERERASKDYEALFQERVNQAASALAAAIRRGK